MQTNLVNKSKKNGMDDEELKQKFIEYANHIGEYYQDVDKIIEYYLPDKI